MAELTLPRSGYAAQRPRGALAASIALNGGVLALLLALPATHYVVEHPKKFVTFFVPVDKAPPPNPPDDKAERKRTQKATLTQDEDKVDVVRPTIDLKTLTPPFTLPDHGPIPLTGGETTAPTLAPPRHDPVLVQAEPDPRYVQGFHPAYPPALQRAGLEGSVTVRVTIDASGRVTAVEPIRATDRAFFEETRDQALRHWRFRPATRDGVPVESQQALTVSFQLNT